MAKEIFVNVDHRETRIAVLVDKQLTELHVEREQRVVGNLYKAKVDNVLPGYRVYLLCTHISLH